MRLKKIPLRGHHLELFAHAIPRARFTFKLGSGKNFAPFSPKRPIQKKSLPKGYTKTQTKVILSLINSLINNPNQNVLIVDNYDYICEFCPPDLEGYKKIRSWIGAPLVIRDQSIGLIVLDNFEPDFYTEEDGETVAAFAAQIAIAIYNARLYEALQQQRNRLAAILRDTTDAIIVLNPQGEIWLMNPAAHRNLKIQQPDITGLSLKVLNFP